MNRIKEITDKKKAACLDKEAASRFVKNALWVREDTSTKDSMVLHSKPSKGNWVEQFKRLWLTFFSNDLFWMLLVCILMFVILFGLKKLNMWAVFDHQYFKFSQCFILQWSNCNRHDTKGFGGTFIFLHFKIFYIFVWTQCIKGYFVKNYTKKFVDLYH